MIGSDLEESGSDLDKLASVLVELVNVNEEVTEELEGTVHDDEDVYHLAFVVAVNLTGYSLHSVVDETLRNQHVVNVVLVSHGELIVLCTSR